MTIPSWHCWRVAKEHYESKSYNVYYQRAGHITERATLTILVGVHAENR